jgi:hypothetical protein
MRNCYAEKNLLAASKKANRKGWGLSLAVN